MLKLLTLACVLGSILLTTSGVQAQEFNNSVSIVYTLNQTTVTDNHWESSKLYTFPAVMPVPQEFIQTGPHDMINTTLYPKGECRNDSNFFVYYTEMHGLYHLKKSLEQKNITELYFGAHISCRPYGLHEWHHHNAAAKVLDTDKWTDDNKTTVLMPVLTVKKCKRGERIDNVEFGVCEDAECNDAWLAGGWDKGRQSINNTNHCQAVDNLQTPMYTLPVDFGNYVGTLTGHGTYHNLPLGDSSSSRLEPLNL